MKILKEIFRDQGLDLNGRMEYRSAIRAVAIRGRTLLMVYSPVNGDYKFPGGGVKKKEKLEHALKREIQEECGMNLIRILQDTGCIIDYAISKKRNFDVFKMTSCYYLCEVDLTIFRQRLDSYEEKLGFQAVWIDIETAIETNKAVLSDKTKQPPLWTAREVFMLEYLKGNFLDSR